ncbi:tRNA (N6-isopentenyl adenosine(37)-C2)-methylthiotransferase MiaB [Candidatus Beckwithbacteria bacterium CG_4_9_14_0_2_um_filter_47_11]|uniref:tRNA-2-methylthio-N(6)-dimethylallyladenosine synthase n=1 Tax=Candidatus Beckwithbacteria bacterium CG_4_9_14_0_2_um_filter_47_11 TaxID=1974494 RepID=A0A2M8G4Q4_9BACT|nr:MAG: tRNA (N6-isopentenyl adenosine(37)-C2)-methylthiotransferase MiaB [Candidatus Beckwithbacteria bacterium CG_4_9_14_0_2_um_filter_47_11]
MVKSKQYFIFTFGCQMNKSDSERVAGDYQARDYREAKTADEADEIVINTCSIRKSAEDRARSLLNNLAKKFREAKRKPKIILTGCMIHHGEEKLLSMLPFVDEILPISEVGFNSAAVRRDTTHAWIPISAGCNSFCTYCIVPLSRGREISRPLKDILAEVKDLVNRGYREITLVGQNVNSYGLEKVGIGLRKLLLRQNLTLPSNVSQYKKAKGKPPFVQLLDKICEYKQIKKLRFMSSNPWDFSDALIDCIAVHLQIDRFIHLPVQSGSNRTLKRMNRGYTWQDYLNIVTKLRAKVPGVTLGTDIIVGFPGETDRDFQATVALAKKVKWQVAFVARYSPRPGTASYRLYQDDIPATLKKKRWQILENLINQPHLKHRPQVIK